MEAIVLAGGFGTRLASVIHDRPKVLAPVGGRPFLELLLAKLKKQGITRVILSVGYMANLIHDHFGEQFEGLELAYAVEEQPLGTGGAARASLALASTNPVFVLNGDTLVELDCAAMYSRHLSVCATVSIAVTKVSDTARYGRLQLSEGRIIGFEEKAQAGPGYISAGIYLLNKDVFDLYDLPERFSIEKDFFMPYVDQLCPIASETSGYFIDIGIPDDLARAQSELG